MKMRWPFAVFSGSGERSSGKSLVGRQLRPRAPMSGQGTHGNVFAHTDPNSSKATQATGALNTARCISGTNSRKSKPALHAASDWSQKPWAQKLNHSRRAAGEVRRLGSGDSSGRAIAGAV